MEESTGENNFEIKRQLKKKTSPSRFQNLPQNENKWLLYWQISLWKNLGTAGKKNGYYLTKILWSY